MKWITWSRSRRTNAPEAPGKVTNWLRYKYLYDYIHYFRRIQETENGSKKDYKLQFILSFRLMYGMSMSIIHSKQHKIGLFHIYMNEWFNGLHKNGL